MNLEDWDTLNSFESVIPCTTPTWALYALEEGTSYVTRIIAWLVRQELEPAKRGPQVGAMVAGLAAGGVGEGITEVEESTNFVRYLDEADLAEAPSIAREWLKATAEAKAREAARKQQQGA